MKTTKKKQVNNRKPGTWKPGESGNPDGRPPKGYSITEAIREMMAEKPEIKKALGAKIIEMALKGDITAIKTVWQYMDGMPQQYTDITTKGKPLPTPILNGLHNNDSDSEDRQPDPED